MTDNLSSRNLKWSASFAVLLLCSACGGGSSSSPNSTPPVAVNQAPTVITSAKSIITEGQPFELDASDSTDRDGDSLTYSWRQISGPAVEMSSSEESKLSLTAPLLETDGEVSFEVSVSDGALTSTSTISMNLADLKTEPAFSEATEYGTGGPQTPSETVGDPSIYEGDKPLDRLIGLTSTADGGYTVHWTADNWGRDMPVSSQAFTVEGEKVGAQVDGVYLGGEHGTYISSYSGNEYTAYEYGINFATFYSGDTLYNLNAKFSFGESFNFGLTSHRGLIEGEIDGFGEAWYDYPSNLNGVMGMDFTPIGESNFLLAVSERTTSDAEDEAARVVMTSYVVDKFGQTNVHELGEYVSNGTSNSKNQMTVTNFQSDSYLAAWSQNSAETGYEVMMRRANEDGILLGEQTAVNVETDGDQLTPYAVTMSGGNIMLAWTNFELDGRAKDIRARVIRPDGSFATDEVVLSPAIDDLEPLRSDNLQFFTLTALNTNEVLLTWRDETSGETELRALVLNEALEVVSNEFLLAPPEDAEEFAYLWSHVLPDNKVIMGWFNDYPYNDERDGTSHTVGFYPVGKD